MFRLAVRPFTGAHDIPRRSHRGGRGRHRPDGRSLDSAGPPDAVAALAAVRDRFEAAWVRWNLVRTLLCTGALACLGWALLLSGRAGAAGS